MFDWWGSRRRTKKQILKEKGRKSYKKGKDFEKKVDPFLRKQKLKVLSSRVHSVGLKDEYDRIVADKRGRLYGVEIKATKQKVGLPTVNKLKKKVSKHKDLLHGGILVSQSGFTKSVDKSKHSTVKTFKYKPKRKSSDDWGW